MRQHDCISSTLSALLSRVRADTTDTVLQGSACRGQCPRLQRLHAWLSPLGAVRSAARHSMLYRAVHSSAPLAHSSAPRLQRLLILLILLLACLHPLQAPPRHVARQHLTVVLLCNAAPLAHNMSRGDLAVPPCRLLSFVLVVRPLRNPGAKGLSPQNSACNV